MKRFALTSTIVVLVAAAFLIGFMPRRQTTAQLKEAAAAYRISPPVVNAAPVKRAAASAELLLPGNVTPITEAYVFARAAGYLKRRYVDIGDRVQAGQLLAEIDAPDLDQQVTQAEAALAQSEAQLGQATATQQQLVATRDLAALTWQRYSVLQASGAVSRQDGDQQSTAAKTSDANVAAGEKNVRAAEQFVRSSSATLERLRTLQGYERVTAPFAGIVTSRNVDVGALISTTGASLGPARAAAAPSDIPSSGEMFRIAEIGRLRVLVSAPQSSSPGIAVGQAATVTLQEYPNLKFPGKVTRTSSSLDAGSRTLLTEVQVENRQGLMLPGMYALVNFLTHRSEPPFLVPNAALVTRSSGTQVAVLAPLTDQQREQQKARGLDAATLARSRMVHFQAVQPGRDYGLVLEILSGLQGTEEVAVDPSDAVQEGAIVQVGSGAKQ